MRKLERETAIRLTLEMWRWLAKTGRMKDEYLNEVERRSSQPYMGCFLCEYARQQHGIGGGCPACPYSVQYGDCLGQNSPYAAWTVAITPAGRKKNARECVERLETLT